MVNLSLFRFHTEYLEIILYDSDKSEVQNKRPGPNNRPGWKRDQKLIVVQGQINVQGRTF